MIDKIEAFLKDDPTFYKVENVPAVIDKIRKDEKSSKLCEGVGHLILARHADIVPSHQSFDPFHIRMFTGSQPHGGPATEPTEFRVVLFFTLLEAEGRTQSSATQGAGKNENDDGNTQYSKERLVRFLHERLIHTFGSEYANHGKKCIACHILSGCQG